MPNMVQKGWNSIVRKLSSLRTDGHREQISTDSSCLYELTTATSGSTGVNLALATTLTIYDDKVHVVPSSCTGPLGNGLSALLLGQSSASWQGLSVLPRCIDADYTGPIGIMIKVFAPPVTIPAGSKTAQLTVFKSQVPWPNVNVQSGGFGSTGSLQIVFCKQDTMQRPQRLVTFISEKGQTLAAVGRTDTGSDVTIIPASSWPSDWPTTQPSSVMGTGGTTTTKVSKPMIKVQDEEGNVAWVTPYIVHTPLWIIG